MSLSFIVLERWTEILLRISSYEKSRFAEIWSIGSELIYNKIAFHFSWNDPLLRPKLDMSLLAKLIFPSKPEVSV